MRWIEEINAMSGAQWAREKVIIDEAGEIGKEWVIQGFAAESQEHGLPRKSFLGRSKNDLPRKLLEDYNGKEALCLLFKEQTSVSVGAKNQLMKWKKKRQGKLVKRPSWSMWDMMVWRRAWLEIGACGATEAQGGESFKNFKNEIAVNHLKCCRA